MTRQMQMRSICSINNLIKEEIPPLSYLTIYKVEFFCFSNLFSLIYREKNLLFYNNQLKMRFSFLKNYRKTRCGHYDNKFKTCIQVKMERDQSLEK